jgi:hypothetical protein
VKNNMRINNMPSIDSAWFDEAHRNKVHRHKPTHYPNGVERPASRNKLDKLVDKWNQTK